MNKSVGIALLLGLLVTLGVGMVLTHHNRAAAIEAVALSCMGGDRESAARGPQIVCTCYAEERAKILPSHYFVPIVGPLLTDADTLRVLDEQALEICRGSSRCTAPCVIGATSGLGTDVRPGGDIRYRSQATTFKQS